MANDPLIALTLDIATKEVAAYLESLDAEGRFGLVNLLVGGMAKIAADVHMTEAADSITKDLGLMMNKISDFSQLPHLHHPDFNKAYEALLIKYYPEDRVGDKI